MSKSILIDTTRCVGCGACVSACKEANGLKPTEDKELTAKTFNVVETHEGVFVRRFCMHCLEPTCASVCPVGAFRKTATGPVIYLADRCIGCRYCVMACPFGIPRYEWDALLPRVQKCTMCAPRQANGQQPACTEACPVEAAIYGERDALLREARQRIEKNPRKYLNHIYGEKEAGGTSVLYLAAVPFEVLGFPADIPHDPLPMYTHRVLSRIPSVVTLGGIFLAGIWWITSRREEVARAEARGGVRKTSSDG